MGAALDVRIGIGTGEVLAGRDGTHRTRPGLPWPRRFACSMPRPRVQSCWTSSRTASFATWSPRSFRGITFGCSACGPQWARCAASTRPWSGALASGGAWTTPSSRRRATARASSSRFSVPQASGSRVLWRSSWRTWASPPSSRVGAVCRTARESRTGPARGDPRRSGHRRRDLRRGEPATTRRRARRR